MSCVRVSRLFPDRELSRPVADPPLCSESASMAEWRNWGFKRGERGHSRSLSRGGRDFVIHMVEDMPTRAEGMAPGRSAWSRRESWVPETVRPTSSPCFDLRDEFPGMRTTLDGPLRLCPRGDAKNQRFATAARHSNSARAKKHANQCTTKGAGQDDSRHHDGFHICPFSPSRGTGGAGFLLITAGVPCPCAAAEPVPPLHR